MRITQIDRDMTAILRVLADAQRDEYTSGRDLSTRTELDPDRINDAVTLLVQAGYVEWNQSLGTAPYDFGDAAITSRGRYEHQRLLSQLPQDGSLSVVTDVPQPQLNSENVAAEGAPILPPVPIGSPYGFTDEDWETVSDHKGGEGLLYTVFGHQFESEFFDTERLRTNVESMMRAAVQRYNSQRPSGVSAKWPYIAVRGRQHRETRRLSGTDWGSSCRTRGS